MKVYPVKRVKRTNLLKRKLVTVDDLFTLDDVNDILEKVNKSKSHYSDIIVIVIDKDTEEYSWLLTNNTLESTAVWLLENTKNDLLNRNYDEDN